MAEIAVNRPYYPGIFVLRLINAIVGIIEAALALRLILELFGANSSSQFVAVVYQITDNLLGPFLGAFPNLSLGYSFVLDITTILAMIAYAIAGWIIIRLLSFLFF